MMMANAPEKNKIVALSGGVGGAKLALGLSRILPSDQLTIVANTADDFEHLGLPISPDLDTVMYTLAELNNRELGWGLEGESWHCMSALERLGGENWFRLGDRDLATHIQRSVLFKEGCSLTEATAYLCNRVGVKHPVLPMSDDAVRTMLITDQGELAFQHYFVREQCKPVVKGFRFSGIDQANPSEEFLASLHDPALAAVVICPSNPFVSVEPIISLRGVRETLQQISAPVIAVSPIVKGEAIKGPTAKMMAELSMPTNAYGVAQYYADWIDGFVLDEQDADSRAQIVDLGLQVTTHNTVMRSLQDRMDLAEVVIDFAYAMKENTSL